MNTSTMMRNAAERVWGALSHFIPSGVLKRDEAKENAVPPANRLRKAAKSRAKSASKPKTNPYANQDPAHAPGHRKLHVDGHATRSKVGPSEGLAEGDHIGRNETPQRRQP